MRLNQRFKFCLVACAVISLAACSTTKKNHQSDAAINAANAAYSTDADGANTQGLNEESSFGESVDGLEAKNQRIYYFDFDSFSVRNSDRPAVVANANNLIAHPAQHILVEGYTDPRGSREYNIGLGERRAKAVADILYAKGVSPAQVRIVSYGAEKRVSNGHSEADYQADRRVILNYVK